MVEPAPALELQDVLVSRRRRGLLFVMILAIIAGLLTLAYVYFFIAPDLPLQAALDRLDRAEPEGWRWDDLQKKRTGPLDSENSAGVVVKTAQALPTGWWSKSNEELDQPVADIPLNTLIPGSQFAALGRELQRARAALLQAQTLPDMSEGRHAIAWATDFFSIPGPAVDHTRSVARLLGYEARLRAQMADGEGALRTCRGMVNAGRSLDDEPNSLVYMGRVTCVSEGVDAVEWSLALTQPSESELERMQRLLEREETYPGLLVAQRGERAALDGLMQGVQERRVDLTRLRGVPVHYATGSLQRVPRVVIQTRIALLDQMTERVSAAQLPSEKQKAAFAVIQSRVQDLPLLGRQFTMFSVGLHRASLRNLAQLRCAIVALAAERFRKKHGRWPSTLTELVDAGFLKAVPADPYDGKPLRHLSNLSDGIAIYSIGYDEVDNAGRTNGRLPNALYVSDSNTDEVFRLWDSGRRRLPPPSSARPSPPPARRASN